MGSLKGDKTNLVALISEGDLDSVRERISCGLCPTKCTMTTSSYTRSPLCCALGKGKLKIAHLFCDIGFLTASDVADKARVQTLRKRLKNKHQKRADFLDKFCFQPMSLAKLCLVAVRADIFERDNVISSSQVPKLVEDTILFHNIDTETDYCDDDVGSLDTSCDSDSEYSIREWDHFFTFYNVEG